MKSVKTLSSKFRNTLLGVTLAVGTAYAATQASDNFQFSSETQTQYPNVGMYVPRMGIDTPFDKLGIVNQRDVLPFTSEYESIRTGKIERGTAKELHAIDAMNDKFLRVVDEYATKNGYDSIVEGELLEAYHFLSVPQDYRVYNDRGRLTDEEGKKYDVDMKTLMQTPKYGGVNVTADIQREIEKIK